MLAARFQCGNGDGTSRGHFIRVPAAITLICWSIVDNRDSPVVPFVCPIPRPPLQIVLNKNTWPEIVNVFLLIAVSTYIAVGRQRHRQQQQRGSRGIKNNKHLMCIPVRVSDTHIFLEFLVNVHHFRDIFRAHNPSAHYNPPKCDALISIVPLFCFTCIYHYLIVNH